MRTSKWVWIPAAQVPIAIFAPAVFGATYLTVEQAQQAIFPGEQLSRSPVTLTTEQVREIERRSDANVRHKEIQLWKAANGGFFIVDEVVGKHEFITYAVGLSADGTVKQIEIMTYRESYGYQVRNADWRAQFVGKSATAPLKLNQDIKNISGATLSCRHIADGVKRILATYEIALK
ncbi:MAG TPA: FMN-binding protein [Candidatus Binatia bacterium]|jgi:Na+-translocating ferredoxin:NAD+ oxidoreductase RnfG subunit